MWHEAIENKWHISVYIFITIPKRNRTVSTILYKEVGPSCVTKSFQDFIFIGLKLCYLDLTLRIHAWFSIQGLP